MSNHTPGPWQVEGNIISSRTGFTLAKLPGFEDGSVDPNARLIAAAPELLEALRLAHDTICPEGESKCGCENFLRPVLDKIRAAIKKTEGRE